ncbi:MAG: sigma 54-interacting transcriptional regulator, partial [Acidobacteriota bacterium]|nr:sigma 54-interacting transcriptional regulator [Acidobacteriota bacterium]
RDEGAAPEERRAFETELQAFRKDSGAGALELFEAAGSGTPRGQTGPAMRTVIDLLAICQESADERAAASRAATLLRERLRASTVMIYVHRHGRLMPTVWAGSGRAPDAETVERATDLNQPLRPAASRNGREAAVPVNCGPSGVGAIGCRWPAGTDVDGETAVALLSAAAAALALHVRNLGADPAAAVPAAGEAELVGASEAMQALRRAITRAAPTPFSVLIEGESGAGKELVARAIHRLGPRHDRVFCGVNCAALPDELFESELFGHARGAFTGAAAERPGLFEEADGGTLFLDEIGELSPRAQAKLLRVLQEGEVRRLGESQARRIDVRIVAATNRSLRDEAAAGRFRRDLLYRLDVIRIVVPPLRERLDDLPALAALFWQRASGRIGSRAALAPETLAVLARYEWPGNVRELQNVMTTLAVTGPRQGLVRPDRLPETLGLAPRPEWRTLEEARRAFEARFVRMVLARAGGHRGRAAAELGLTRQGLAKLMARLAIDPGWPAAGQPPAGEAAGGE